MLLLYVCNAQLRSCSAALGGFLLSFQSDTAESPNDSCMYADDEEDVNVFRKIRHGQCDVDDPIWQRISSPAKDLVVGAFCFLPCPECCMRGCIAQHVFTECFVW